MKSDHLENAYTDAPNLYSNIIVGSLQLLFWFFFHPSAWRNYVLNIDSTLSPDFALIELSKTHWRYKALRRLLIQGFFILPLLLSSVVGFLYWSVAPQEIHALAYILATIIIVDLIFASTVSVSVGIVSGLLIGGISSIISFLPIPIDSTILTSIIIGVIGSLCVSTSPQRDTQSFSRQLSGIIVGVLLGVGVVTLARRILAGPDILGFILSDEASEVARSLITGIAFGVAISLKTKWRKGVLGGSVVTLFYVFASLVLINSGYLAVKSIAGSIIFSVLVSISFVLPYVLATWIAGSWAGALAGTIGSGTRHAATSMYYGNSFSPLIIVFNLLGMIVGLTQTWWRSLLLFPLFSIWNLVLYRIDERRSSKKFSLLRLHPAFWDEFQLFSWFGLNEHIVLVLERNPEEGQAALDYLLTGRQRWAAQAAQIEMDARQLERLGDVRTIGGTHRSLAVGELTGPANALLRSLSRISQDVEAAINQESAYNQRLALSSVEDRLDGLLRELTRSSERYAERFRPIVVRWREVIAAHVQQLIETVETRQEIDSPYIIGVPLTEQQEIFVGRTDISAKIEQLLLDRRRPPLLLYGQRRMGKTSLLNNLGRMLPSTVVPLFVDLQGASRSNDLAGFFYNVSRDMIKSAELRRNLTLPLVTREALTLDPFTRFDEWLDEVEGIMDGQALNTALLALDEFETLDQAIAKGRFDEEDVLGILRHLIQHRPRFKVLLAGSHTLNELQRWSSYLINVQVIHLGCLSETEACKLIERPVKDFSLHYEADARQRVIDLTRGHPFLVQLLCAEIVALKNEQDPSVRRLAGLSDVEASIPEALSSGSFFFADIERNQIDNNGLDLLKLLAVQEERAITSKNILADRVPDHTELERSLALLKQRELIEQVDEGYCFQIELIRRWFANL